MNKASMHSHDFFCLVRKKFVDASKYLVTWILMDIAYICVIQIFLEKSIHLSVFNFFIAHFSGIGIGTMVMFTGLGAGVLWIPILTFLEIKPSETVSISIFTQIAGKGMGSVNYLLGGMVDLKVAGHFIPFALLGALMGYISGFIISIKYEKVLLYIFLLVASYLLVKMIQSLSDESSSNLQPFDANEIDANEMRKSYPIVILSSFFTGLLSIGNSDWLIPHMERKLNMSTSRSVATGLFIMFITSLFFLFMTFVSVHLRLSSWPQGTTILFATCSGVILGGQIGTRLIRYQWFRERQKHAFILLLAMSIIHLMW